MAEADEPIRSRFVRTARIGRVAASGASHWARGKLLDGRADDRRRRRGDRIMQVTDALVDQLALMRGAAMKVGQALSTVDFPGLDPDQAEYVRLRLGSLRDDVPPLGWEKMRRLLAQEWGQPVEDVLAIEPDPRAAASIGQVYRGRDEGGRCYAIKIQYPGIADTVEADMRNMRLLTPLLKQLLPGLDVSALLAELGERIAEECDYELEAQNQRQVWRYWRDHPFVVVPRVETSLSTRRVLVSDWIDGQPYQQIYQADEATRDRFAEILFRFFYATAAAIGMVGGDPHPGNYLWLGDRVAFFDFGMMRRLPPDYLSQENRVAEAIRRGDAAALVAVLDELGYLPDGQWDGQLLLDHMQRISWWLLEDEPVRLDPEQALRATEHITSRESRHLAQLRQMTVPPEALLLRRMEGLLFQVAVDLRAEARWGAILAEVVNGGPPVGPLGDQHRRWQQARG